MGFFNRVKNSWSIFTLSLSYIRKDKSLLFVPYLTIFGLIALLCIFFFSLMFFPGFSTYLTSSDIITYSWIALFLFCAYLVCTFLGAMQAWMVYEVAHKKDATLASGMKRAFANIWDILGFAVVAVVLVFLAHFLQEKGNLLGKITGGLLEGFRGIAQKLVLPAMIVTEKNFAQAVKKLKHGLRGWPEILTIEIGLGPLIIFGLFASFGISFLVMVYINGLVGIVVLIMLVLSVYAASIFINQVYYTLLYLSLIERMKIPGLVIKR
jgi:hypothetical protein